MRLPLLATFASLLAVTLAPTSVAAQPARAAPPTAHQLVISVDVSTGALSYSADPLRVRQADRIVFSAPGVDEWVVTFTGDTPFRNREVRGTGTQSRTVPVLPNAAVGSYKYDVSVTVGGQTFVQDPEIIVRPRFQD